MRKWESDGVSDVIHPCPLSTVICLETSVFNTTLIPHSALIESLFYGLRVLLTPLKLSKPKYCIVWSSVSQPS